MQIIGGSQDMQKRWRTTCALARSSHSMLQPLRRRLMANGIVASLPNCPTMILLIRDSLRWHQVLLSNGTVLIMRPDQLQAHLPFHRSCYRPCHHWDLHFSTTRALHSRHSLPALPPHCLAQAPQQHHTRHQVPFPLTFLCQYLAQSPLLWSPLRPIPLLFYLGNNHCLAPIALVPVPLFR